MYKKFAFENLTKSSWIGIEVVESVNLNTVNKNNFILYLNSNRRN
jgi:hypothetical protein